MKEKGEGEELLGEEAFLACVGGSGDGGAAAGARTADHAQHLQLGQRAARHEDALGVGARIGGLMT